MEFYANSWPTEEGVMDKRSWVRGQWIPYDEDAINQFLGHPLVLKEGQRCEYTEKKARSQCGQRIKLNVLMMPKFHMRLKALFKTKKLKIFKMDDQDSL